MAEESASSTPARNNPPGRDPPWRERSWTVATPTSTPAARAAATATATSNATGRSFPASGCSGGSASAIFVGLAADANRRAQCERRPFRVGGAADGPQHAYPRGAGVEHLDDVPGVDP